MLRYLEVPDFHFSPSWADISVKVGKNVRKTAKENHVDFISLPGDLHNAPIMATDHGGINILRKIVASWLEVCPVIAIEGTKSHDGTGCYGPLEDMGVVVLRPAHSYGLISEYGNKKIIDITNGFDGDISCVIFGVPELDKKNIVAREENLSTEEANIKVRQYFNEYVRTFMAPERLKYESVPAICLIHGNFSDSTPENETDTVLRASDIVIHTQDLRIADIDRWSLGHIHTPWESKVICGGYSGFTGMDSNPYGKLDFVPASTLVSIDENKNVMLERKPYGTPMRKKVSSVKEIVDTNIAYWVDTENLEEELPKNAHPWSRITHKVNKKTLKRITKEQADKAKSLSDLLKLLDPLASKEACEAIDSIPSFENVKNGPMVHMELKKLSIYGSKFFHGKTVKIDFDDIPNGVTALMGGNGEGKSSLLSFCTPYPAVVGKDTMSGRMSAIKDFFEEKDSRIEKEFLVNGLRHSHKILIQGAHTKNPRVECYLSIDGEPVLDKSNFDEMFSKCEELYGKMADYRLINFYEQPLQSQKGNNGIMSASMVDIRNLVQIIAGIDRSREKSYALSQSLDLHNKKSEIENKIIGAKEFALDFESLEENKKSKQNQLEVLNKSFIEVENEGKEISERLEELKDKKTVNDFEIMQRQKDQQSLGDISSQIIKSNQSIKDIQYLASNADNIRDQIEQNNKNYESNNKRALIVEQNQKLKNDFINKQQFLYQEWQHKKYEHEANVRTVQENYRLASNDYKEKSISLNARIDFLVETQKRERLDSLAKIESMKKGIKNINNPCPNCGYIAPDIKEQISKLEQEISEEEKKLSNVEETPELKSLKEELGSLVEPQEPLAVSEPESLIKAKEAYDNFKSPAYNVVPELLKVLSQEYLSSLQQQLSDINVGNSRISEYQAEIATLNRQKTELEKKEYNIDPLLEGRLERVSDELEETREKYSSIRDNVKTLESEIASVENQILVCQEQEKKIAADENFLEEIKAKFEVWDYIAKMLNPNKIPALELELLTETIDEEANRIIEPYKNQRFLFRTETQVEGVDKFAIMINDSEFGIEKNFFQFSPGEKTFLSDAYTKALIKVSDDRAKRFYSPIIMDESDGPLDVDKIATYYQMQHDFWKDSKVLVVSHSPTAHERIDSRININDLKM